MNLAAYQQLEIAPDHQTDVDDNLVVHLSVDGPLPASFRALRITSTDAGAEYFKDAVNSFELARQCF